MTSRYQDVYPQEPLLESTRRVRPQAAELLTLEFFEAEPAEMPERVFEQHHVLLNLREEPHRVENLRDGERLDFLFQRDEVIVTPAGLRSGWRWHARSKVIVITLEPQKLERFAQKELGVLLSSQQLRDQPQFHDPDLCRAGELIKEALEDASFGSDVLFESLARIFLVKLIQRYGERRELPELARGFTSQHYKRVLDYVAEHYARPISVDELAGEAGLSASHFSRLFKETIGLSPHRYVMDYRVERARDLLADPDLPLAAIANRCGFADQAHFSRTFKQLEGVSPGAFRGSLGS